MKNNTPEGESIRIRLPYQLERKLIAEKNRTGKSISQITREALTEYFRKRQENVDTRKIFQNKKGDFGEVEEA